MSTIKEIFELFDKRGNSQYGGEAITQLEHALQSASLAECDQAPAELIVAALLHDLGHLLHELADDAPEEGIDDQHENSATNYLRELFPEQVTEPIRLHVAAKRFLCAVDVDYLQTLSQPSVVSLGVQGGPMTPAEVADFQKHPYAMDAVQLRRWDDSAKVPNSPTPTLLHFAIYLMQAASPNEPE